ncbi:SGNH/GDSL hydrolase family protein [Vibrio sp. DNB22_10_4]
MKNPKPKALIITDSLGLPRTTPERVTGEQSWPYLLANHCDCVDYYFYCRPGLHSQALVNELDVTLGAFEPDIIIVQLGIVDCTPRALTLMELSVVSRIPIVNKLVKKMVAKYRRELLNLRLKQYVNIEQFRANLNRVRQAFPSSKILALPILANVEHAELRTPNLSREIVAYNNVIDDVFELISVNDIGSDSFMTDHYHLSISGNQSLFEVVMNKIEKYARS